MLFRYGSSFISLGLILLSTSLVTQSAVAALSDYLCTATATDQKLIPHGPLKEAFLLESRAKYPQLHFAEAQMSDLGELQPFINESRSVFFPDVGVIEGSFDKELKDMRDYYLTPKASLFVIRNQNGKIVGSGGFAATGEHEVELQKIYLAPELRGLKLGKFIVQSLIDLAKSMGHTQMWLTTVTRMTDAIGLYKSSSIGFKEFVPRPDQIHVPDPENYVYLHLDLTAH